MIEDFLRQQASIEVESALPGGVPQDALGGADRSAWQPVCSGVPCMVRRLSASQQVQNAARGQVCDTRIYFASDPVPTGLDTRHRITVGPYTYRVTGAVDPNSLGRLLQVDCELLRFP